MALAAAMPPTDSTPKWSDIISDSEDENETNVSSKQPQPEVHLTNRFEDALMDAARHYSGESELPSVIVSNSSPLKDAGVDLEDLEEVEEEQFSDSDEEPDRPTKLTSAETMSLFYKPVAGWNGLASHPIENARVIKTLHAGAMCEAFIKQGSIAGREITYISKTWILDQRWEGFFSEMALYSHPNYLQTLQGSVIPTIIGVYLIERRISIAMELPHSSFWVEATEDMSDSLKRKCIAAFDRIHDRGVLHGDAELRHMLISGDGDVTIIDFQLSQALRPIKEVGLDACTPADILVEKRKVLFKLNYGEARAYEHLKRRRVFQRAQRNAKRRERRLHTSEPVSDNEDEDPDDAMNPIVPPGTWTDEWLSPGLDFVSSCMVVPGQDAAVVESSLKAFVERESMTKESETSTKASPEQCVTAPSACVTTSSRQKRKRRERGPLLGNDIPSPKKRTRALPSSRLEIEPPPVPLPADFCNPAPVDFKSLIGMDVDEIIVPPEDRPHLHIPFEGWDGKGGGVLPNELVDDGVGKHLGDRRRRWIMDANAARCRRLGLPHPSNNPSPTSSPQKGLKSRRNKLLFKKPSVAIGSIKRNLVDNNDPTQAPMEMDWKKMKYMNRRCTKGGDFVKDGGEGDSDDEHPELPCGPKIIKWSDFNSDRKGEGFAKREVSIGHSLVQRANVGSWSPGKACRSGSLRGALRRPFTLEERLRQKAYERTMLALKPPEDSEDEAFARSPKVFSIHRDLNRTKRPPALNASAGPVSIVASTSNTTALATLEPRPAPSASSVNNRSTFNPHPCALSSDDHRISEPTRQTRSTPKSHDDHPHASAPARSFVTNGSAPPAPNETKTGRSDDNCDDMGHQTSMANAPPANAGSISRVPRRRWSLQGRRGSQVTSVSSSPSAVRPTRRRSNSSPPNVLVSSAIHRYINVGVRSAPATPTAAASGEGKNKAVEPTSNVEVRSAVGTQFSSCGVHLMDTLKKWL